MKDELANFNFHSPIPPSTPKKNLRQNNKDIFKFKVLAPKCSKDERPKVLEAYIKLLSLPPIFKVPGLFL